MSIVIYEPWRVGIQPTSCADVFQLCTDVKTRPQGIWWIIHSIEKQEVWCMISLFVTMYYCHIYHREASQCLRTCSMIFKLFYPIWDDIFTRWMVKWELISGVETTVNNPWGVPTISAWTTFDWKVDLPILINHLHLGLITLQWI